MVDHLHKKNKHLKFSKWLATLNLAHLLKRSVNAEFIKTYRKAC